MKKRIWCRWLAVCAVILSCGALMCFLHVRGYHVQLYGRSFTESAKALSLPDCGFYTIRGYVIDTVPQQFQEEETEDQEEAGETAESEPFEEAEEIREFPLKMVQINLRQFRDCPISDAGLTNIETLFSELCREDDHFLVRFLYDWDGRASLYEPDNLEIILTHIRQVGPILRQYEDRIAVVQGLLIGNWGEMNGTPFTDWASLCRLATEMEAAAGENIRLAVRTPAFWRIITGITNPEDAAQNPLASRLSLYNDGMLGSRTDCGTYMGDALAKQNPMRSWSREDELAFQDVLCALVPNGGEVILDNAYNDFPNALRDLRTMHVSYLNWEYDRKVLNKWAAYTVSEPGCFDGFDGLTYIERHLGSRYFIDGPLLRYDFLRNRVTVGAELKNTGFAPLYSPRSMTLTLVGSEQTITMDLQQDIRSLPGGNSSSEALDACAVIPLTDLKETDYTFYLKIWDPATGQQMELANGEEPGEFGYELGQFTFSHAGWYDRVNGWLSG